MYSIKEKILAVAIALVLAFFIGLGINTFYEPPVYQDFCDKGFVEYLTPADCEAAGGKWSSYAEVPAPRPVEGKDGYCNVNFQCNEDYQNAREFYNRNVFIITLFLGTVALLIGTFLVLESVGAGLMGGGALTIVYGTMRYWGNMSKLIRWLVLGIVLAVLIWIGYKKLHPDKRKK